MLGIIITLSQIVNTESVILRLAAQRGFRIHIRKPDVQSSQIAALVDPELAASYSVHYHPKVAEQSGCGLHCRGDQIEIFRRLLPPDTSISCSCHSWEEVEQCQGADYVFISPIFDSISKSGYRSGFDYEEIASRLTDKKTKVIALGGITHTNIPKVKALGFDGWASLGSVWELDNQGNVDIEKSIERLNKLTMESFVKLQYITRKNTTEEVLSESLAVLKGGCRWIQLRMKDADHQTIVETGRQLVELCHRYGAIFLINDSPQTALEVGADGVHLGKSDMPIEQARIIMGNKIIGATANTAEDIVNAYNKGADYIGLGPFRFTNTKKNLSPILGLERISNIVSSVREQNIMIPIVTIGGINLDDCPDIVRSGVNGIAISGAIGDCSDPENMTAQFLNSMKE
jgi:thiamine-phosphate pyrophosphorylase